MKLRLTDKQKKMLGLLNSYHGKTEALGGPGLLGKELEQMFGKKATTVRKQLEKKGLVEKKNGRWVTVEWLSEWMYMRKWAHCDLQDTRPG